MDGDVRRILITGGAGFVGAYAVREFLKDPGVEVVSMDSLTYAGNLERIAHLRRVSNVCHDIGDPITDDVLRRIGEVNVIVHLAAESHVPRSIVNPRLFVRSNVIGTMNVLEAARAMKPERFIYVSTDEVFGPAPVAGKEKHSHGGLLRPSNPYSASKASGEFLVRSYFRSFDVPAIVTRCVNMFGKMQNPEKFVPIAVAKMLRKESVPVHTINEKVCSRCWAYAGEHARALAWLSVNGIPGEFYHVSSGKELTSLEMVERIASVLGVPVNVSPIPVDRPGHDLDYAIEESSLAGNWKCTESFEELLERTVLWMRDHREWLK